MFVFSVLARFPLLSEATAAAAAGGTPARSEPLGLWVLFPAFLLCQGINGIDGGRGLGALVALGLLFVLLDRVLADEGAVLVELALAPFSVVHQAVVALLLLYRPVQRGLAVGKRFVVFIAGSRRQTDTARVEKRGSEPSPEGWRS